MTSAKPTTKPISRTTLTRNYYEAMHDAFNSMFNAFTRRARENGLSQDKLSTLLEIDKGLVSRRLKGSVNLTLRTLSHMASAMECYLEVRFTPYEDKPISNYRWEDESDRLSIPKTSTLSVAQAQFKTQLPTPAAYVQ